MATFLTAASSLRSKKKKLNNILSPKKDKRCPVSKYSNFLQYNTDEKKKQLKWNFSCWISYFCSLLNTELVLLHYPLKNLMSEKMPDKLIAQKKKRRMLATMLALKRIGWVFLRSPVILILSSILTIFLYCTFLFKAF